MAFKENRIKENIAESIVHAKEVNKKREFLTLDEVKMLAATPCEKPVLKAASLFSCMTGLRISDILRLEWDDIRKSADGGWCMHIITKKTKTEAILPLSDEALELCGERKDGKVFEGLTMSYLALYLKDWIKAAGITKPISFHGFRHTFATLQLAAGTDLYTISKMLTHSNISTTQIYADVVNDLKRKAAGTISLKSNNTQNND
jgi:integrase